MKSTIKICFQFQKYKTKTYEKEIEGTSEEIKSILIKTHADKCKI